MCFICGGVGQEQIRLIDRDCELTKRNVILLGVVDSASAAVPSAQIMRTGELKVLAGFLLGVGAVIVAAVVYVYSGTFNVAALEPPTALEFWAFSTVKEKSVKTRAQAVTPPPTPPSQKTGEAFRMFGELCVQCHGAPGKEPNMVGKGLNPAPAKLPDTVQRWSRAELFWIVKNGIKMTGMPAFGPRHSDEDLWLIVAFLQRLPNIRAEEFKEMAEKFGASQGKQPQSGQRPEQKSGPQPQQEHKH